MQNSVQALLILAVIALAPLATAQHGVILDIVGDLPDANISWRTHPIGDVNADGYQDIACFSTGGFAGQGHCTIYSGVDGVPGDSHMDHVLVVFCESFQWPATVIVAPSSLPELFGSPAPQLV